MPEQEFDNSGFGNNNFYSQKNQEFSHESLVMIAMRKVLEFSCGELIAGYYNTETDIKGKVKIVYKQDTRKAFIESVRSLRMVMICDFDDKAQKKLIETEDKTKRDIKNNLMDKLQERKEFWIAQQNSWWNRLNQAKKEDYFKEGSHVIDGYFNVNLPFYNQYFLEELEIYRLIYEELTLLTKRIKFYKSSRYNIDIDKLIEEDKEIFEVH